MPSLIVFDYFVPVFGERGVKKGTDPVLPGIQLVRMHDCCPVVRVEDLEPPVKAVPVINNFTGEKGAKKKWYEP